MSPSTEALETLSRAFAARDVDAALACFADDDAVVYAGSEIGEVASGQDGLRVLLAALFERDVAYSWHITKLWSHSREGLELVTADAIGHARGGGPDEDFAYRLTGVLSREANGWRWVQLHGAEPTHS